MSPADTLFRCVATLLVVAALPINVLAGTQTPEEPETVHWKQAPIRIVLQVGVERRVSFPARIRVGVPPALANTLRTQIIDRHVYWLAKEAIAPTRVVVREQASDRTYLIDLSAHDVAPSHPLEILAPVDPTRQADQAEGETVSPRAVRSQIDVYTALTRYAAQRLYAPRRLHRPLPGTRRVPVASAPVALLRGVTVEAVPLAAWRHGAFHVTAIRLTNQGHESIEWDPRYHVKGDWLAIAFQHGRIGPAGSDTDSTAVYLISRRRFEETL